MKPTISVGAERSLGALGRGTRGGFPSGVALVACLLGAIGISACSAPKTRSASEPQAIPELVEVDVAHVMVDIAADGALADVEFVVEGGEWDRPIGIRVGRGAPVAAAACPTGECAFRLVGEVLVLTPGQARPGVRQRVAIQFEGDPRGFPPGWVPRGLDPGDRATLSVSGSALSGGAALPASALAEQSLLDGTSGAEEAAAQFVAFAERTLLVRDPAMGEPLEGGIARAWFGLHVAAPLGPAGASGMPRRERAVGSLADLLVSLFAQESPEAAAQLVALGLHRPAFGAEESARRWRLILGELGEPAVVAGLRRLVETYGGADVVSFDGVVQTLARRDTESDLPFLRAWLGANVGPEVQTQWRWDAARGRVLLRVDQLHAVTDGVPPAFPFTLPVSLVAADGRVERREVSVTLRRDLFELELTFEPTSVLIDPDGVLSGVASFSEGDDG